MLGTGELLYQGSKPATYVGGTSEKNRERAERHRSDPEPLDSNFRGAKRVSMDANRREKKEERSFWNGTFLRKLGGKGRGLTKRNS